MDFQLKQTNQEQYDAAYPGVGSVDEIGKIWLQENSTDFDIIGVLEEKGVPKSDIVLGFQPEDVRGMTEYAMA